MSAADRQLRDMWMAEMWAPVREWHPSIAEQARVTARNEVLAAERDTADEPERQAS